MLARVEIQPLPANGHGTILPTGPAHGAPYGPQRSCAYLRVQGRRFLREVSSPCRQRSGGVRQYRVGHGARARRGNELGGEAPGGGGWYRSAYLVIPTGRK